MCNNNIHQQQQQQPSTTATTTIIDNSNNNHHHHHQQQQQKLSTTATTTIIIIINNNSNNKYTKTLSLVQFKQQKNTLECYETPSNVRGNYGVLRGGTTSTCRTQRVLRLKSTKYKQSDEQMKLME